MGMVQAGGVRDASHLLEKDVSVLPWLHLRPAAE